MKSKTIGFVILTLFLSTGVLAQNQSIRATRDLNVEALASAVEKFSAWKSQAEEVVLDLKKRGPLSGFIIRRSTGVEVVDPASVFELMRSQSALASETDSTLRGVKWLYEDSRASVNALIERVIFDLKNRTLPKGSDPYRESILNAETKVNAFLTHSRNLAIRQAKESQGKKEERRQFAVEEKSASANVVEVGWPAAVAAVSFLAAAIELTTAVVKHYSEQPKNAQSGDSLEILISQLRSLQLRPFDKI